MKYIPEWFPGAEFKTQARIWREGVMDMIDKPWEVVKERMVCFVRAHISLLTAVLEI